MTNEQKSAKSIFMTAVDKHRPEEWSSYLDDKCGEDHNLRSQVEALLKAHINLGEIDQSSGTIKFQTPEIENSGSVIGPYKLLQKIGEGGMGVVYMAEQSKPVKRRVALKIIKPGMDSKQVIARFEAERQALAMMDHPNIAKILDAGATKDGRPYFVMELVKGVPITKYCDEHQLSTQDRLELFAPVCRAIQHAHQKGVIHRDIKPSNVLVGEFDDRAVPRIIDFGIAKATEQRLTEKTMFTQYGQIIGTLDYMSPEQAKLNELDIDTRSDIYSLGVLLYELLTGETPINRNRLHSAAFDELLRIIREEQPPKPSVRISTLGETAQAVSTHRNSDPKKLGRLLHGDLDWIVMKALDKDRTRRYDTAAAFADDIRRHLHDEPVVARPPSLPYRVRKLASRNKRSFSAALSFLGLLLVGIIVLSVLLVRLDGAYTENKNVTEELEETNAQLVELLHVHRDQQVETALALAFSGKMDETTKIAVHLEEVLEKLDADYEPDSVTSFLEGIACFYSGDEEQAREHLEEAVRLDPKAIGPNAILAVHYVYNGDWAAYLDNIPVLDALAAEAGLDSLSEHELYFYWYGKLYADPAVCAGKLQELVPKDSDSVFGQALTTAALAHAAVDKHDEERAREAVIRADAVLEIAPNNPWVMVMSLYAYEVLIQLTKSGEDYPSYLIEAADEIADRLALHETYLLGRYELALYYDRTGHPGEAKSHYEDCSMVRDTTSFLMRDAFRRGEGSMTDVISYLESCENTRYVRLSRLLVEIGKSPNHEILAEYEQLINEEKDLAFRIDALEIPLLLGETEVAKKEATELFRLTEEYSLVGYWIRPLAAYIADMPEGNEFAMDANNADSRYEQLHVNYWIGLKAISEDDRDLAKESFQACLDSQAFDYSNYAEAMVMLERLNDPLWPPR
jgi:serine/threonine protein kinase